MAKDYSSDDSPILTSPGGLVQRGGYMNNIQLEGSGGAGNGILSGGGSVRLSAPMSQDSDVSVSVGGSGAIGKSNGEKVREFSPRFSVSYTKRF